MECAFDCTDGVGAGKGFDSTLRVKLTHGARITRLLCTSQGANDPNNYDPLK